MNRDLSAWLLGFVLLGVAVPGMAAGLSFEEAHGLLRGSSDALRAAEAEIRYRESDADAAASLGYPEVSLKWVEINGSKELELGPLPFVGTIKTKTDLDGPRSAVSMTWPIYTGGRITALQQAKAADAEAARAEHRETGEKLDSELVRRYFGLRFASDVVRLRQAQLTQAESDFQRALRFEKHGQLSALERLSAQVARDEAEREYIKAEHERMSAQVALSRFLRSKDTVEARTPLFVLTRSLQPLPDWLQMARDSNPSLVGLKARRDAAEQGVEAARAAYRPEVFAYGEYNLIKRNLSLTEPNWIAGIGISYKLFSREDRASKVGAARAQAERVESLRAEALNRVETLVETAWLRVEQSRRQFELFGSNLELARENLRLRSRAFEEGQATVIEVNEARNALLRAETGRARIAYEFDVALMALLEACGQGQRYADFVNTADVSL